MARLHQEKFCGVTRVETIKLTYEWTVYNINVSGKKTGEFILSPSFSASNNDKYKWYLRLYPNGWKEEYKDYIALFLQLESQDKDIEVEFDFCILNDKGKEEKKDKTKNNFHDIKFWGFPMFLKQDYLKDSSNLSNNRLIIRCNLMAGIKVETAIIEKKIEFDELKYQLKIYDELEVFLQNKDLTDITLVANGIEFYAHKAILAMRSPVFLAMLKNDMREKAESKIEFDNLDSDVLSEMLRYIYTGKVENIEKYLNELLFISDKYALEGLKVMCERCFYNKLSITNAVEILVLADRHNCDELKNQVINFIVADGKSIIDSPEFKVLKNSYPSLIYDVLSVMTSKYL